MSYNNRNIEILKRAYPHLDSTKQRSINIILKLADLTDSINQLNDSSTLSTMESDELQRNQINIDELLRSLRPICRKKEQDIIDFILNFSKTKEVYNTYKALNLDSTNFESQNLTSPKLDSLNFD